MTLLEGKIIQRQCLIMAINADMVSGAYKLRKLWNMLENREMTDEEALYNCSQLLSDHLRALDELVAELPVHE